MDSALGLKIKILKGEALSPADIDTHLDQSAVFRALLGDFELTSLNLLHRLIELSEIPFSDRHEKVRHWREELGRMTYCDEGFSLTGNKDDILACYNAMITTVLLRLNYPKTSETNAGIRWIVDYQNTARNQKNNWQGKGIQKYGGCMKSTPCFIGVVKSMVALNTLIERQDQVDENITTKLQSGLEYILEHEVYKKLSTDEPITNYLNKLTYPYTYKTNVVEILGLLKSNHLLTDPRTKQARDLLLKKQRKDGFWRVNAHYKPKYWVDFDPPKEPALWLSNEIENILH